MYGSESASARGVWLEEFPNAESPRYTQDHNKTPFPFLAHVLHIELHETNFPTEKYIPCFHLLPKNVFDLILGNLILNLEWHTLLVTQLLFQVPYMLLQ